MPTRIYKDRVEIEETAPYIQLKETTTNTIVQIKNVAGKLATDDGSGNKVISFNCAGPQMETKTVAADSTGVKASSAKFKLNTKYLKSLLLRASVSSIPSDATVRVEVYDATSGTVLGYVEFAGATGEKSAEITSGYSDGDLIQIRINVTVASATAGSTATVDYAIVELNYEI